MDLKARVYLDFAKVQVRIDKMKDGKDKAKAQIIYHFLAELLNTNNAKGLRTPYPSILVFDSTGRCRGVIKEFSIYNLKGKKIFEATPKTTLKEITKLINIEEMLEEGSR